MSIHKDLGIHQYLDDWLVRARSHQACLQHTKELREKAGELREIIIMLLLLLCILYSAQYLHILQDSKRYLTNPTV